MLTASCVCRTGFELGEGCVWNEIEQALYLTDIERGSVFKLEFDVTGRVYRSTAYPQGARTGCLVFHREGGFIAAVADRLVWNRTNGERKELLRQTWSVPLRYNDGKCDKFGNFWVGTMAIDQDWPGSKGCGNLYCIKNGRVVAEYPGFTIPNGLDWNRDGTTLYHIDTPCQSVDAWEVSDEYRLSGRRKVIAIPKEEGSPDGMCMDEDGHLWIALWGGGKVVCHDPADGRRLEEVLVPEPLVSCCCFGGPDGRDLFITTAQDVHGMGGHLYCVQTTHRGGTRYLYRENSWQEGNIWREKQP